MGLPGPQGSSGLSIPGEAVSLTLTLHTHTFHTPHTLPSPQPQAFAAAHGSFPAVTRKSHDAATHQIGIMLSV